MGDFPIALTQKIISSWSSVRLSFFNFERWKLNMGKTHGQSLHSPQPNIIIDRERCGIFETRKFVLECENHPICDRAIFRNRPSYSLSMGCIGTGKMWWTITISESAGLWDSLDDWTNAQYQILLPNSQFIYSHMIQGLFHTVGSPFASLSGSSSLVGKSMPRRFRAFPYPLLNPWDDDRSKYPYRSLEDWIQFRWRIHSHTIVNRTGRNVEHSSRENWIKGLSSNVSPTKFWRRPASSTIPNPFRSESLQ
jgi:hypothetical protein